ncbi:transglutaminase-like cysteine peptidase [Pararhizobium sp.]|uniref:transglutaminase-like cysteine peptidase n=1 Tax=Pararhizobium sp. TaxID=1977563 RepID=UPI0027266FDC|nr:transglutaminase-like cysteine peptidase [Pararhizobium sp.]MDO9415337.1 transglutaminase-like cysteine peptidase [Pararhizobium sp.]
MKKNTATLALLGFALTALTASNAWAFPANMAISGSTNPPIGHYDFCKTYSSECRDNGGDAGPAVLTRESWKTILNVNYTVNEQITPLTDKEIYGVEEQWAYPRTVGDCEDYVLLKRRMLMKAGFSPSDLLITVVLQPNGDGHAILTVRTDRGDFVLDNMRNKVLLWSETEYRFLKRQSAENSGLWVKIQDGRATTAVGSIND